MIAEIISVGTELLLGDIVNTNAQYLAKHLAALGIEVHYQTVVGDNPDRIKNVLDVAYTRADMAIMTGGLGPTKDDLTKERIAAYFGKQLILDQKAVDRMANTLKKVQKQSLLQSLIKQAYVPTDSVILYNHNGLAPGCIMEDQERICILLPGPPKEMEPMFETYCIPYLKRISEQVLVSVTIQLLDFDHAAVIEVGEAPVADRLAEFLDLTNPTVATYTKEDGNLVRITARAANRAKALEKIQPVLTACKERIGEHLIQRIEEDKG